MLPKENLIQIGKEKAYHERRKIMDWYGTDNFAGLPAAFGAALMANETAIRQYNGLTEAEKEKVIMLCRDAGSEEEITKIINGLVPGGSVYSLFEERG